MAAATDTAAVVASGPGQKAEPVPALGVVARCRSGGQIESLAGTSSVGGADGSEAGPEPGLWGSGSGAGGGGAGAFFLRGWRGGGMSEDCCCSGEPSKLSGPMPASFSRRVCERVRWPSDSWLDGGSVSAMRRLLTTGLAIAYGLGQGRNSGWPAVSMRTGPGALQR